MNQATKKCNNQIDIMVQDDSSWGYHYEKGPCGDSNQICNQCVDLKNRQRYALKHHYCGASHYCGKEEGFQICQANDSKNQQCGNCKNKDREELEDKKNQNK